MNRFGLMFVVMALLTGCAHVEPWQKAHLARPEMQFGADALDSLSTQHTYNSKEAASGGSGVGGGGCGCN